MIAVIDTEYLIERQIPIQEITKGYITDSVVSELRTADSERYLNLFSFMMEVRNPTDSYVRKVRKDLEDKIHNLSQADIDVVALTLEIKDETSSMWIGPENPEHVDVCCLTHDNGIKNILAHYESYSDADFHKKVFKIRCYTCLNIFSESMDFCKKCGHSTLTRITVREGENGEEIFFKKGYNYKKKTFKDSRGVELRSADQREYVQHQIMLRNRMRQQDKSSKTHLL